MNAGSPSAWSVVASPMIENPALDRGGDVPGEPRAEPRTRLARRGAVTSEHSSRKVRTVGAAGLAVSVVVVLLLASAAGAVGYQVGPPREGNTCPDPPCTPPPPPTCPKGTVSITINVVANATNATLLWKVSPAATVTLVWGNSTAYAFTAIRNQNEGSGENTYPINFLNPNSTYYYQISGSESCYNSASHSGSWKTGADSTDYFTGTVKDPTGATGGDVAITLTCTQPYTFVSFSYVTYLVMSATAANGSYSLKAPSPDCTTPKTGYIAGEWVLEVSAASIYVDPTCALCFGTYSTTWAGHWNETIVTWAPQVVSFVLPQNYVSGFIPMTYDFTNSSYTTFTVASGQTFTTSESYGLSVQASIDGLSVGTTATYSTFFDATTTQSLSSVTGKSLLIQQEYFVTGTEVFSVISRAVTLFPTFFEASGTLSSGPTSNGDWLAQPACNSDPGVVYCMFYQGSNPFTASMTDGGSVGLSSSYNIGISVPLNIGGIGLNDGSTFGVTYTTGFSTTSSTSYSISISVAPPSTECYEFEYEFQGDSSHTNGITAHVWNIGAQPLSLC
jgi:hypothetical protein